MDLRASKEVLGVMSGPRSNNEKIEERLVWSFSLKLRTTGRPLQMIYIAYALMVDMIES